MTELLINSGLPIFRNCAEEKLIFQEGLSCGGYGTKKASQMPNLLSEYSDEEAENVVYDVYRDIIFEKDRELFNKDEYRYDITYIMPGTVGNECKKTSGHYHCYNPEHTNTYPEVYEVLYGTAMFILQRSDNFEAAEEELVVNDLILVKVEAGQTLLVPANYGHCSINIGEGPMIFSNLAYVPCGIDYNPVKSHKGMAVFAKKIDGELVMEVNKDYKNLPDIKYAKVKENPKFGIEFGKPVYNSYVANPQAFEFLGNVDPYTEEIMDMLQFCGEGWT